MKKLLIAAILALFAVTTARAEGGCEAQAKEQKLAGAAKTSFLKKCNKDAGAACEAKAGEQKLAGAAKTSFVKKCKADAK